MSIEAKPASESGTVDESRRALPRRTPENSRLWDSCQEYALELQRCDSCERFWYYPSPICPHCSSLEFTWTRVSGAGTVHSYTWVRRAAPGFENHVPYCYALVELAEGPIMATNIVNAGEGEVEIGTSVQVHYLDISPEVTLPLFATTS